MTSFVPWESNFMGLSEDFFNTSWWTSDVDIGFDVAGLLSNEMVLVVLSIAVVTSLLIYITGRGPSKSLSRKVEHNPVFGGNKPSSASLTEALVLTSYVALWGYIVYSLVSVVGVTSIMASISANTAFFAMINITITYMLILALVLCIRWVLIFIIYSMAVAPSVTAFSLVIMYPSPASAVICVAVLLATLIMYELFFDYLKSICDTIKSSSGAVLKNFAPISKMLLISTTVFSIQAFILYSFLKTPQQFTFWDWMLLLFALDWSWTIYQYFNKAFMSSAIYLSLEEMSSKRIFGEALRASVSSFGAICSAAFVPSLLRTVRIAVDKMYEKVRQKDSWILFFVRAILYVVKTIISVIVFLLDFFNESFIPYVGIYGGRYNKDTVEKAMKVMWKSPAYQILSIPSIKSYLSTWMTTLLSTALVAVNWFVMPLLGVPELSMPTSLSSLTSSMAVFAFCVILIYSFVQCMDAAIAAKVCHDYDMEQRKEMAEQKKPNIDPASAR